MNTLIKQPLFWVATAAFLLIGMLAILYLMPPLLQTFQDNRSKLSTLDGQITSKQSYLDQINTLKKSSDTLTSLYASASQSLPTGAQNDLLSLQLEGLTKSLGLNLAITVPFNQASTPTVAPTTTTDTTGTVQAGGAANSTTSPTVTTTGSQTTFTLSGPADFNSLKTLLAALRSFGRWNKVTTIELSQGTGAMTATVTAQVFWKNNKIADFAGDSNLITKARAIFSSLKTYTTAPNAATEGAFGRGDPFAKP
ncbi:MAG TPA: hypothetical protein VMQ44_01570 [Candidatus Saccharimonadales bacterium]|nr:hypothetical protein [Candidatus Saccharimonadales bacterium]